MQEKLAISVSEACSLSNIGRTAFYAAVKRGAIRVRKNGRRTLVLRAELQSFLESLPTITTHK
jgi:excisionase family DNA binding protein